MNSASTISMTRLQLFMDIPQAIIALSEGNPGAITVLSQAVSQVSQIDPDNILGALGFLLQLDSAGIYGSDIWVLYKRVCGERLPHTVAVLRASQLGLINRRQIKRAIQEANEGMPISLNADAVAAQAKEQLPTLCLDP